MSNEYEHNDLDDVFRVLWKMEAHEGRCDAWGGAESRRVFLAWVRAGRPSPITSWIREHANTTAEGG